MPHRLICAAFLLASCAVDADRFERPPLSSELEERTGHGLGPAADPGEPVIPEGVTVEDGVSTEEAVAIALWNNAAFQAALSELGLKRAELIQAGLLTNPSFSLLFPLGPKQLEATLNAPFDAIWLRPGRIAIAEIECERVAELLVQGGLDLVRDVRVAFADLALARTRTELARELLELRERTAGFYAARLRAGDVGELEAREAEIARITASQLLAQAAHEQTLVEVRLRAICGVGLDRPELRFADDRVEPTATTPNDEELLRMALATRPDLRAAELQIEQAGERAGLARWQILRLSGVWDANERGTEGFESGPGLQLELPLFDRGQARSARAAAELELAVRQLWSIRHRIAQEVAEASASVRHASASLQQVRTIVAPAANEARDVARRAFEQGHTSLLPVLQQEERLGTVRTHEAQARNEYLRARAQLERSVGRRLGSAVQQQQRP